MKHTLHLGPVNGGAFNCLPARHVQLEDSDILANNVIFPGEFNPHNVRLWVIGNEFGAVCALWADCEQDAWDELIDQNRGDGFLISEEDQKEQIADFVADGGKMDEGDPEDWTRLGNAGEPCDLTNAWIQAVVFDRARDFDLMLALAEARGATAETLYK